VLQLTKRTEYGLIALIHIADRAGLVVSVREIADHYPVPRRLLAEVVKDLAHAGLLESQRGALGGYVLARPPEAITLGDVVVALEGAPLVASCESESDGVRSTCDVEPVCPIRSPLHRLREGIWRLMERTTLRSLCSTGPLVELDLVLDLNAAPIGTAERPIDARVETHLPNREHSLESTHGTSTANHS
jgi:Rrf2 family nitric oxide-sensitive transcriptional repressor